MKTRQEMIYEFMLALAGDFGYIAQNYCADPNEDTAIIFHSLAEEFADAYLKGLA